MSTRRPTQPVQRLPKGEESSVRLHLTHCYTNLHSPRDRPYGPIAMNAISPGPTVATPTTLSAHAISRPPASSVTSHAAGMSVCNGRPCSSSSAWAATPTAKKKTSSVATRRVPSVSQRGCRADDDVGEVRRRIQRVQHRPPIASAAPTRGVELGPRHAQRSGFRAHITSLPPRPIERAPTPTSPASTATPGTALPGYGWVSRQATDASMLAPRLFVIGCGRVPPGQTTRSGSRG